MNFILDNLIWMGFASICALVLTGTLIRYSIRSYFTEKRRNLSIMMRGDVDVTNQTEDISWKDKLKEKDNA